MTDCTQAVLALPGVQRRKVEISFDGGDVTSDAGVLLLRLIDRYLDLTRRLARLLEDDRRAASCLHPLVQMLRQRIYAIALGYEDLNDHGELRSDLALQTAVERVTKLAHPSTLCRLENKQDRASMWAVHELLADIFIESFAEPPTELVLDFDATDDAVHGNQEGRAFHGYYDHYCFLPLYVFCGEHLLVAYLRPADADPARHAAAILKLLVRRLREAWPDVRIVFRGDSAFCRWKTLAWCDRNDVDYIVGLARNSRVVSAASVWSLAVAVAFMCSGKPERIYGEVWYGALSWDRKRRVVVRAQQLPGKSNPRFVVTSLDGTAQEVYERYCERGEAENRIKEQQLGLFADRTSAHRWWANQWRLLMSSLAYVLLHGLRRLALKGTELARAQATTIRLKLLKVGAVIIRNTRRIRVLMSSAYPRRELWTLAAQRLDSG